MNAGFVCIFVGLECGMCVLVELCMRCVECGVCLGLGFEGELCVNVSFVCLFLGLGCDVCVRLAVCMRCVCGCRFRV